MAGLRFSKLLYAFAVLWVISFQPLITPSQASNEERKVYIVYMGSIKEGTQLTSSSHFNMLQEVVDNRFLRQALVRSYRRSFNAFAANLTVQERDKLANHEEVVSIFPSTTYYLHTTRSWDFMGLTDNVGRNPTIESDIIIGLIDSGTWPESESFSDEGFGTPPKKWKGICKGGQNFTCNNKLIGARVYNPSRHDYSARDMIGHGTHTSSIAAGNYVKDVSFEGIAKGTARGGVPSARIAMYKCGGSGCRTEDVLAAFNDAIADGVDFISISAGPRLPQPLEIDAIAIAALHASQKGILVVQSAGNSGMHDNGTVISVAPWVFSVGASTTDRGIISNVSIGNRVTFTGKTVNTFHLEKEAYPLIYGKDATNSCSAEFAQSCQDGCLEDSLVKGKIVLCNTFWGIGRTVGSGAVGAIALSNVHISDSFVTPFPASSLSEHDFRELESYYSREGVPTVGILTSESIKNVDAPQVANFSSRGPNIIVPDILKPDVTAPGVEILAAFSPEISPSRIPSDKRSVKYNILSGTSMSCPHVTGAAAYVKSIHPNWSPSAIKSALMTSAWSMNSSVDPLAEFSYGAGHIDPVKATDPGLVYETYSRDYAEMLCGLGYDNSKIRNIFGGNYSCSSDAKLMVKDLNYPSMTAKLSTKKRERNMVFSVKFTRTVTNVGAAKSSYNVTTSKHPDYSITVSPTILTFEELNEKKSFEVLIRGKIDNPMISASLEWFDGIRKVRSPIVVY